MSDTGEHLPGFAALKDDGSTTCASWIYSGIYPKPGTRISRPAAQPDPEGGGSANLKWGYSWPANRRILYNRASARPEAQPWSRREEVDVWVRMVTGSDKAGMWTGGDVPDFAVDQAARPPAEARRASASMRCSGTDPFIMKADGKGWLFAPTGLVDGPLPTHYEPMESPVRNRSTRTSRTARCSRLERRRQSARRRPENPDYPVRPDHLPADGAPPLRGDEPLAAVAGGAAAGAVRRDQPGAGAGERHRQHGVGARHRLRAARSGPRRW